MDPKAKSLFVNRLPGVLRIVVARRGRAEQIVLERLDDEPRPGDIFLSRVSRVTPGIQAAFVDLGEHRSAFLNRAELPAKTAPDPRTPIESILKQGQALPVQIAKPAREGKLPQAGAEIKLVGFFIILNPYSPGVRFSRHFNDAREPYVAALEELNREFDWDCGWIVRSDASGAPPARFLAEARWLADQWRGLAQDLDGGANRRVWRAKRVLELIRQHWRGPLGHVHIDDAAIFDACRDVLEKTNPSLLPNVKLHSGDSPLFDVYDLESEIQKASASRVWLKSGGYLDFHRVEALTLVDVNSGKNAKRADAALRTNLEAVDELALQLRARNLGGLAVIDFINADQRGWAKKVEQAMARALIEDPAATDFLAIDRFGLMRMTRQRADEELHHALHEPCPRCRGAGWVQKLEAVIIDLQRRLARQLPGMAGERLIIACGFELAEALTPRREELFGEWETSREVVIEIRKDKSLAPRQFEIELS